jgi:glycine/D-amino acid oxidase-like deaminating enzyme
MPDVVVVGAGIVGASIAYHAAQRGCAVTLVDRASPASGVTGGSFAWIGDAPGSWPGGSDDLRGAIMEDYRRLQRDVPGIHVRWCGSLSFNGSGAPDGSGAGVDPGPGLQVLDASQVAALEPNLREPPARAIYASGDGGVDPRRMTLALVRAARDRGAEVVLDAPMVSVDVAGGRVVGVTTPAGRVGADTVVLAAGTGVPALCEPLGVTVPVVGSPALLLHVRAPAGLVRTVVATPEFEVRETGAGHLVMTAPFGPETTAPALELSARRAVRSMAARFGALERVQLLGHRLGRRPMPAGGPVIGPHPALLGLYVAVMHSAICLAPTVGRLVANEIVTGRGAAQLARCRPDRFQF